MSSFEEWWTTQSEGHPDNVPKYREIWDAATYAANNAQGVAANEAEKDARRKVAVEKLSVLWQEDWAPMVRSKMDAIIKECQG